MHGMFQVWEWRAPCSKGDHMQTPVDITFRSMEPSIAVEHAIRSWAARLDRTFDRIERCAVVIETPHRHQRQGKQYRVRIEVTVPDRIIAISHEPGDEAAHDDVYVAIADAFRAARRQLQEHAQIRRGDVKLHA